MRHPRLGEGQGTFCFDFPAIRDVSKPSVTLSRRPARPARRLLA